MTYMVRFTHATKSQAGFTLIDPIRGDNPTGPRERPRDRQIKAAAGPSEDRVTEGLGQFEIASS